MATTSEQSLCRTRRHKAEPEKCRDGVNPCAESPGSKTPGDSGTPPVSDTGKTLLKQCSNSGQVTARYARPVEIVSRFQSVATWYEDDDAAVSETNWWGAKTPGDPATPPVSDTGKTLLMQN